MTLGELIDALNKEKKNKVLNRSFINAHSYRGNYTDLAFELGGPATVKEILETVNGAMRPHAGYKGGNYNMSKHSEVHIAEWGCLGEGLGPVLLEYLLNDVYKGE